MNTLGQPALCDMLGPSRVRELGMEYRRMASGESDVPSLSAAIQQKNNETLETGIRKDFATGQTVIVKGWVLSVTEARQCALFSLLCP